MSAVCPMMSPLATPCIGMRGVKIKPSHLLILLTNHKPHADTNDSAFWDRLRLVTFNMRFVDHPVVSNERTKDTTLWDTLEQEASGILAWLVRGCLEWQREGLSAPSSVLADGANRVAAILKEDASKVSMSIRSERLSRKFSHSSCVLLSDGRLPGEEK